jgi:hypothetical protein
MAKLADKQQLIDTLRGEEKIYSQMVYTMGFQRLVKAISKEEAISKFQNDHIDVIADDENVDCEDHSEVVETDMEVTELYGE